jgi:hypothetical protein
MTPTFSVSPSPTVSPSPPPILQLTPKFPNPDPGQGPIWLPYVLTTGAQVTIRIFDVSGELVRDLDPFAAGAGANEEAWDGRNGSGALAASGVFIAHIVARKGGEEADAWVKLAIVR